MSDADAPMAVMSYTSATVDGSMRSATIGAAIAGDERALCPRLTHHGHISYALRTWQTRHCRHSRRASCWRAPIWITTQATTTQAISPPCANDATWHTIVRNIAGSVGGPCSGAARWAISSSAYTAKIRSIGPTSTRLSSPIGLCASAGRLLHPQQPKSASPSWTRAAARSVLPIASSSVSAA